MRSLPEVALLAPTQYFGAVKTLKFLPALMTAAVVVQAPAQAEPPLVFTPNTRWVADFATDNCALRRGFVSDGKTMTLELNSYTYGDSFQVKIYGDLATRDRPPKGRFEPDEIAEEIQTTTRVTYTDGKKGILYKDTIFQNTTLDPASDEAIARLKLLFQDHAGRDRREGEITGLSIQDAFSEDVLLKTGSLHGPMEIMRKCLADLAQTEGLDPVKIATLSREVTPKDTARWAREIMKDYPSDMVRDGKGAAVDVRVIVDETGKPISCKTRDNGQEQSFTSAACDGLMKYAKFEPALDSEGKPVKGYFATSVIYRIF